MNETLIDLIRHGEPVGGSRYRGNTIDDPLSEKGWAQMRQSLGDQAPWSHIISSPMIRCHAFAAEVSERHGLPLAVHNDLKEIGFGAWEGKTKAELRAERLDEFNAFYRDPVRNTPENAEPVNDFLQRIGTVYEQLLNELSGEHILVVAHAGVIRAMITHAVNAPADCMYRLTVTNGGISRLRVTTHGNLLEMLNGELC